MSYNIVLTADNSSVTKAINETEKALNDMTKTAQDGGGQLDEMFNKIKSAAAGVFAGLTIKSFIQEVVKARGEMQQLEVAFTTMLGNKAKADKLMDEMTQTALITPFEFNDVANGARQLIAYGEGADTVNDTLIRLGNISSGLSQPLNDIVYLYGTTRVQGRLFSQDLNQFTNRGIPMIQMLAQQFGVTEDKVKDLVSEGKVGFPEVQKVIESLTNEGGMFYNLMEEQSKTITGQISNLQDQFANIYNEIGKQSEGVITSVLGGAADLLDHWESIGKALMYCAGAYGVVKGALMAYVAVQKASAAIQTAGSLANYIKGFFGLTKALQGATAAQKAMNAAALANPYALLAAAVVGLVYGLYKLVTATDAAEDSQAHFNEKVGELKANAEQSFDKLRELEIAYKENKISIEEYNKGLEELKELYPDIIKAHTNEETKLLDIVEAQKAVNKAIETRIATEELANLKAEQTKNVLQTQGEEMLEWTNSLTEYFTEFYKKNLGMDDVTAKDKAKRTARAYKEGYSEELRNFDFSAYDMTDDSQSQKALTDLQKSLQKRLSAINVEYAEEAKLTFNQRKLLYNNTIKEATTDGYAGYFNNTLDAYIERAEQVQKATEMYSDLLEDSKPKGGGKDGTTPDAAKELTTAEKLANAWENYYKALEGRQTSKNDEAAVKRYNTELKTLQEEIVLLEKSLKGHRDITAEISNWNKASDDAFTKEEAAFNAKQIASLKKLDPNYVEEKKTTKDDSKETARAELSEAQKLAFQKRKADLIAQQAEIDVMEDGTEKKLKQIKLDYDKRLLAIEQGEARLKAQAEADKKNGTGTGEISEDDALGLKNEHAEAYNEYLKKVREVANAVLNETQSYWDKRAAIIQKGQANIANIQALQKDGLIDGKSAERRTAEVQKGMDSDVASLDISQAQQDPAFKAWQSTLNTMALKAMKDALAKSEEVLKSLESDTGADDDELVRVRAQVATLKNEVSEAEANPKEQKNTEATAKSFKKLATRIVGCVDNLASLEEAITGTKSKATQACQAMLDFSMQLIDTILDVAIAAMQEEQDVSKETSDAIKTMERASVILAIIGAVIQAVTKMVQIFSDDSAEQAKLEALSEYYSALADTIGKVIERQEELMENATGDQVTTLQSQTKELYEKQLEAYRNKAITRTSEKTGGNKHTIGYHENKKIREHSAELEAITGRTIQYASELAELSPEELKQVQEQIPGLWASFEEQFRGTLENIIETGEAIDELDDKAAEVRLGFSYDDLQSSFVDCLTDLESTSEDFSEDLEDNLRKSIINGLVFTSEMKTKLQSMYDQINKNMADDSLTDEEKMKRNDEIKQDIENEYAQAREKAEKYYELAGLDGSSATEAETAGFSGMSQETAEELNGRFTAIQGHTYLISQSVATIANNNKVITERLASIVGMTNTLVSLANARNEAIGKIYSLMSDINAKGLRLLS